MKNEAIDYTGMVVIYDRLFNWNAEKGTIHSIENKSAALNVHDLKQKGRFLKGFFNETTGCLVPTKGDEYIHNKEVFRQFYLPLEFKNQFSISNEGIKAFNATSQKNLFGAVIVDNDLNKLLNGIPIEQDVLGKSRILDLASKEIKDVHTGDVLKFPANSLYEYSLIYIDDSSGQQRFYDPYSLESESSISCYRFPPLSHFDPVSFCKLCGYPPTFLVCQIPWDGSFAKVEKIQMQQLLVNFIQKEPDKLKKMHKHRERRIIGQKRKHR